MENEVIVHAGCEGGSITLYGVRNGRGWLYSCHLVDHIAWMLEDGPWIENDSEVVSTWAAALKLLDKYEFNNLSPLTVHPEFRAKVLKAVLSRNKRSKDTYSQQRWQDVCGIPAEEGFSVSAIDCTTR
jgi:hypothetical protein